MDVNLGGHKILFLLQNGNMTMKKVLQWPRCFDAFINLIAKLRKGSKSIKLICKKL